MILIEFNKDVNGNIYKQIRLNDAMLNGLVEASCELYEEEKISAEEALRDIRTAMNMRNEAWGILMNTKSDYAGKRLVANINVQGDVTAHERKIQTIR